MGGDSDSCVREGTRRVLTYGFLQHPNVGMVASEWSWWAVLADGRRSVRYHEGGSYVVVALDVLERPGHVLAILENDVRCPQPEGRIRHFISSISKKNCLVMQAHYSPPSIHSVYRRNTPAFPYIRSDEYRKKQ